MWSLLLCGGLSLSCIWQGLQLRTSNQYTSVTMRFDYVPHDIYIKLGLIVNTFGEGGGSMMHQILQFSLFKRPSLPM